MEQAIARGKTISGGTAGLWPCVLLLMGGWFAASAALIDSVLQGSPASEAGLRPGDLIQSIDGLSAEHFTLHQVQSIFLRVGAEHHLTVERGKQILQADIRLRNLF